ncbi:hypothetical protein DL95DRAFT_471243 [Leptodontidium sp. 2 PMI_412]|nr:hypothetical protein DL95DRAFT_471243 [Leptodontidium sp. 2 PMI_412]
MAFRPIQNESYLSELPITPPTPCPSPTLGHANLQTPLEHRLPKVGDPELRSLPFSHRRAFSLPKNTEITGGTTSPYLHWNLIPQNDSAYHGRDQQIVCFSIAFRQRAARAERCSCLVDRHKCDRVRYSRKSCSPWIYFVGLGEDQSIADDFRTGCNPLDMEKSRKWLAFGGTGAGEAVEAGRINAG